MIGRLLFPALRAGADGGFEHERATIEQALYANVGGFVIFGGDAGAVRELTGSLRARSMVPLLIGSDLERGAGQQFRQATALPPLAAIGSLDDVDVTRRCGSLTGREALAVGVNWLFAPVADVDLEPRNPIVGSRAFGADAQRVAAHVAAWIGGTQAEGALCCAKHFPGHGRTVADSHAVLPRVTVSREALQEDLEPFRAAIAAGVAAVMTAHVVYEALDEACAATVSHAALTELLRTELGFQGLVASDALNMGGMVAAGQGSETRASIGALNAGCNALLYPSNLQEQIAALTSALGHELSRARAAQALEHVHAAAARAQQYSAGEYGATEDRAWADEIALRSLAVCRGEPACAHDVEVITIDDDVGGPFPAPARAELEQRLQAEGFDARAVTRARDHSSPLVAVYADIRAWKGAPGLSSRAAAALQEVVTAAPDATILFFGHPRLAVDVPGRHILAAWGGEPIMQRAAARWLAQRT